MYTRISSLWDGSVNHFHTLHLHPNADAVSWIPDDTLAYMWTHVWCPFLLAYITRTAASVFMNIQFRVRGKGRIHSLWISYSWGTSEVRRGKKEACAAAIQDARVAFPPKAHAFELLNVKTCSLLGFRSFPLAPFPFCALADFQATFPLPS